MAKFSETLTQLLTQLNASSPDIQASAIVSQEGLLMAALMDKTMDEDHVAAMTNAMVAQATRCLHELRRGRLQSLLIRASHGYILMQYAGHQAILTVLLKKSAQLGFIFLCCQRYAVKIAATGIAKPNTRIGLVYLGKRKSYK
ncbi:MAG: roadblock/LC7 domain-containing protein [Gammaproteobacteria bacterium]